MRAQVCYTIGHSNHTIEKFVGLLRRHKIAYLIDVRSSPYSQHVPQFNKEVLDKELKKAGIKELFTPGTPLDEVVKWVEENVKPRDL